MKFDITFHPSWWHKNAGIDFSEKFFTDAEYRMKCDFEMRKVLFEKFGEYGIGQGQIVARPLIGTDLLAAGYIYSAILGCEIVYKENDSPQVISMNYSDEEIGNFKFPNLKDNSIWQNTLDQINYLEDKFGKVEIYHNLMGICNIAMDIMGDNAMVAFYTNPEGMHEFLSKLTDFMIEIGKVFKKHSNDISGGVTRIIREINSSCYLTSNCTVEMVSNELYEEFLLGCDQKMAEQFGDFGVHHCGQTMEHIALGYSKIPNLTFVEVGAGSDVAKVREVLPHIDFNVRYSAVSLKTDSREVMKEKIERILSEGSNKNKQVSISCVGIDGETSDDKIKMFLQICKDFENEF